MSACDVVEATVFPKDTPMIDAMDLYQTLHRKPFEPFRVHLTDGRSYDIRYPRNNVAGTTFFVVGIPAPEDPEFIAERTIKVPLELIDRIESLGQSPTTVPA